ncbi:MAG: Ig-like domain-containing protein, partial [Planctomycetota bacterium]
MSPGNASVEWSGLSIGTDYEWFVEVTDTTDRTTVGPVWSFTTALAPEASNPDPPDWATGVDINADLSWSPGINAVKHDVYFGTNPDSLPLVSEDQTGTTYDPGTIPNDTLFFWRIDECDENGDVIAAGYVWSFTTAPVPGPASYPSPADGATEVSTTAQLSWTAGSDTTSHKVYFGTVDPPPFVQNQSGTTFDPGLLDNDVTYYWQIDEIGPGGITLGAVWSFTAEPVPPLLPWSDDFESVGFSVGGWTTSGNVVPSSKSAYSGSFGAEMKGTAWIEKAVSTVGFTDIRITYARKTKGLDNGEFLYVEWSDGSTWHELEATQDTDWGLQDLPCVGADGNADFKLRFRNNASNSSECCYVDDVEINSTPSGPVDNPPSVDITNPSDGATVSSNVTVSADAIDDDGVTQVEFFVDGVSIGVDTDSSDGWSASWNTIAEGDGSHTVGATATDTALQIASDSISVTVDNVDDLPTVSITNPSDGATVSGNVTVNADATDDKGVTQVEFFVGGSSIGVDTDGSDGWSASWDTTAEGDGSHTVGATATDTASQIASDSISVTVDNAGPSTVSVQSIDMDLVSAGKNWKAVAKITISPVASGATVIGDWYLNGSSIQTDDTGVTDGSGYTELTSPPKKAQTGQAFTFVVTDVVLSGYVYDPPVPDEATKVVP